MRRLTLLLTLLCLSVALPVFAQGDALDSPPAAEEADAPALDPAATPNVAAAPAPAVRKPVEITDEAQRIWEKYGDAIYQVQVIDLASDKKNSIGSGFQFTKDGMMATNYHVVSEAVQRHDSNRLEYLDEKGTRGKLKVLVADVGHDLAILQMDPPGPAFVELGKSDLPKGTRLFSLGNPHDITFTIIEGTHNGLNRESFIDKIHFSGSLNPGMSGGPVLGHDGRVVGVNVSTAGNQISFLVPVEPLKQLQQELLAQKPDYDFIANSEQYVENQLLDVQSKVIDRLMADKWESVPFGPFMVPGRINAAFKCWGDTMQEEKQPYKFYSRSTCQNQDRLFLDSDFDTGIFMYRYDYLQANERLSLPRFYSYYENQYEMPLGTGQASEDDLTNFDCHDSFVDLAGARWKASFCVRQYKKYPQLYDMQLYMALVSGGRDGFMVTQIAEGVSKDNALKLAQKFMQEIRPRPQAGSKSASAPQSSPAALPVVDKAPKAPAQATEGAK